MIITAVDWKPKRTNDLKRLRNISANPHVTILADHYDEDWSLLWWVRTDGVARILHGDDRAEPIAWLVAKYDQYTGNPPTGPVIWIDITRLRCWSGQAVGP